MPSKPAQKEESPKPKSVPKFEPITEEEEEDDWDAAQSPPKHVQAVEEEEIEEEEEEEEIDWDVSTEGPNIQPVTSNKPSPSPKKVVQKEDSLLDDDDDEIEWNKRLEMLKEINIINFRCNINIHL